VKTHLVWGICYALWQIKQVKNLLPALPEIRIWQWELTVYFRGRLLA
jgi:hypothetical protein